MPPHCIVFFYLLPKQGKVFVFALFVAFFVCSLRIGIVSDRIYRYLVVLVGTVEKLKRHVFAVNAIEICQHVFNAI